jgi:hypothetical protein
MANSYTLFSIGFENLTEADRDRWRTTLRPGGPS